MSRHLRAARAIPAEVMDAISGTTPKGIAGRLLTGGVDADRLRQILEEADETTAEAVVLAYRLGLLMGVVENKAIRAGLDAAREKSKAYTAADIYRVAHRHGWRLPVSGSLKARLRDLCMKEAGMSERTFRKLYPEAVKFAENVRADERSWWLAKRLSEVRADGLTYLKAGLTRRELLRARREYKTRFGLDGHDFRKDLIRFGGTRLADRMKAAK